MQNSLFSQKDFIAASRQFVCVRLESYESKEHQDMVRQFLGGSFANTAFAILAPDGETQLSRSGRGPNVLLGRRGGPGEATPAAIIAELQKIADNYPQKGKPSEATLPDFHTTRQALNVASGDQRLLLLTVASKEERDKASSTLQALLNDFSVAGRFHHDFAESDTDRDWAELVEDETGKSGFVLIVPDPFGQKGSVVAQLPLTASAKELKETLLRENTSYASVTKRKIYRDHVREGREKDVYFPNGMPYGEDRDGDGVIDPRRERRGPR